MRVTTENMGYQGWCGVIASPAPGEVENDKATLKSQWCLLKLTIQMS